MVSYFELIPLYLTFVLKQKLQKLKTKICEAKKVIQ
jgi:hypothetical protein